MADLALGLVLAVFITTAGAFAILATGVRRLHRLADADPVPAESAPLVSIIVAARDEARGIEAGLGSLLALRYPRLEVIVVDDRSTDETPAIVARLAASDPRVAIVRVDRLPAGWLGKNHALATGAGRARGEWLLFTDADIVMHPDTLARAIGHATRAGRDHVTLTPRLHMPGALLEAFAVVFASFFCLWTQPWNASNPRSRFYVGVGAFNLVRRAAYARAGTHERIALRPDDDLKLAKILKQSGASQELLTAEDLVSVEWYGSTGELVRGLEKNAFAGLDYRIGAALGGALMQLVLVVVPVAGILVGVGLIRWLSAATIVIALLGFADAARGPGIRRDRVALYPVVMVLFAYIILRTLFLNLAHGGIRWRGTFYPLSLLKSNRV